MCKGTGHMKVKNICVSIWVLNNLLLLNKSRYVNHCASFLPRLPGSTKLN